MGWLWLICDLVLCLLTNCGCVGCLVCCFAGVEFARFCCEFGLVDLLVYFVFVCLAGVYVGLLMVWWCLLGFCL